MGGGSPLPPGAGLIFTTRQWHSAAQYKQLHRKPSSDKNTNIVQTTKMTKHPPILQNMSDCQHFTHHDVSFASLFLTFNKLLGTQFSNYSYFLLPDHIQSKENPHLLLTSFNSWIYLISLWSLQILICYLWHIITEDKPLRSSGLFLNCLKDFYRSDGNLSIYLFLTMLHSIQDLYSPTWDRNHVPCSEIKES